MVVDDYQVYLGPLPDTLGVARTYHFSTAEEAWLFAEHSKAAAWADYRVDRKVTVRSPEGVVTSFALAVDDIGKESE